MCCRLVGGSAGFAAGKDKLQAVLCLFYAHPGRKEVLLMPVVLLVARYFLGVLDKENHTP